MDITKITVLDMQPIDPPVGGGRIRLIGLYSGMKKDVVVTYVGSYDWPGPKERQLQLAENLTEIDIPLSDEHFAAHHALAAEVGKSCIDSAFPIQGGLSKNLIARACTEANAADAVIFSHPWLFPFVAPEIDDSNKLIVYDSQNCEGLLREKLLDNGSAAANDVCRAVVSCEYELCRAADLILACSEEDKTSFINLYGVEPEKIIIVPNGVFTERLKPNKSEEDKKLLKTKFHLEKPTVCFIGSDYDPNYEAALLVVETAKKMPDIQFVILGGVGERFKAKASDIPENVRITGFIEESEKYDYLHACDIAVNPMLSGSGTNIKMFDFMAAGLPVVTTDIGARGIENTNGCVYHLCGHDSNSLKSELISLISNHGLCETLSKQGRHEAELRYSWETISSELGDTIKKEVAKKRNIREKVLIISTYPPERCGIGRYAQQQAMYLREHGSKVDVLAIRGNGKYRDSFDSAESIRALSRFKETYDRIILQYHASFFYSGANLSERIERHKAFAEVLNDNPKIEIVCHEIVFPTEKIGKGLSRAEAEREMHFKKEKWNAAKHIIFHTEKEKAAFCANMNLKPDDPRFEIVSPHKYYIPERNISQSEARAELNIPQDILMFLCIGFIQPHKAFDKVARAFEKLDSIQNRHLYIVGSLRFVSQENLAYLEELKNMAGKNNIHLLCDFVSDRQFDTWIIASDCVVIPYSEIWSSGVLGRAKANKKRCIAHDTGGLSEQIEDGDKLFREYDELPDIISSFEL